MSIGVENLGCKNPSKSHLKYYLLYLIYYNKLQRPQRAAKKEHFYSCVGVACSCVVQIQLIFFYCFLLILKTF